MLTDEKKLIMFDLGLTGYEDLGLINNCYVERISIGSFKLEFQTNEIMLINANTSVVETRYNILEQNVKKLKATMNKCHEQYEGNHS